MTEHQHQVAVIKWARGAEIIWPELALLHAIPNGGLRDPRVAKKMKREGVKPGVPDLCLPVPRNGYNGVYIELKTERGRVTTVQKWWLARLREQGYVALVCRGATAAIFELESYLGGYDGRETYRH